MKRYEAFELHPDWEFLAPRAREWGLDQKSTERWFKTAEAQRMQSVARDFLPQVSSVIADVEQAFDRELPGAIFFMPSYGEFDGFARYDLGEHQVLLGVDFPDADVDYLKALTAHELSHVYRDHSPAVWQHLGQPLHQITRSQYLESGTAQEHLVSEGLATLFSQVLYPQIPAATHHFYEEAEYRWCVEHSDEIGNQIRRALRGDQDVWSFYAPSRVAPGSPSRTQYYWASKMLGERVDQNLTRDKNLNPAAERLRAVVALHQKPAEFFSEFSSDT